MNTDFAVIGGSQAYELLKRGAIKGERLGSIETPFGPSQPLLRVEMESREFLFLSRHGETSYEVTAPYVNYRANIYALREKGARRVLAWSGPGAIRNYNIGQYVIPDDLIDETRLRKSTFFEGKGLGFIRQYPVFCPTLREVLKAVLTKVGMEFSDKGTYVCTEGPRLETPAEVRKYAMLGGDLVGMTLVPEVFLAKELEMCYVALCYITNFAEGMVDRPFKPGELFEGLASDADRKAVSRAVNAFPTIMSEVAKSIETAKNICHCQSSMERYRRQGRIEKDWHEWVK